MDADINVITKTDEVQVLFCYMTATGEHEGPHMPGCPLHEQIKSEECNSEVDNQEIQSNGSNHHGNQDTGEGKYKVKKELDIKQDIGPDTRPDTGPDTGQQFGPDTRKDTGLGTRRDTRPDTREDTGPGTRRDTRPDTRLDTREDTGRLTLLGSVRRTSHRNKRAVKNTKIEAQSPEDIQSSLVEDHFARSLLLLDKNREIKTTSKLELSLEDNNKARKDMELEKGEAHFSGNETRSADAAMSNEDSSNGKGNSLQPQEVNLTHNRMLISQGEQAVGFVVNKIASNVKIKQEKISIEDSLSEVKDGHKTQYYSLANEVEHHFKKSLNNLDIKEKIEEGQGSKEQCAPVPCDLRCDVCGKRFVRYADYSRHRSREHRKPFICQKCGQRFRYRGHLTSHELIHSGEKPFKCRECGKTFRQSGTLLRHLRLHGTTGTPFKCPYCNMCFGQAYSRRVHMRSHANHVNANEARPLMDSGSDTDDKIHKLMKLFDKETRAVTMVTGPEQEGCVITEHQAQSIANAVYSGEKTRAERGGQANAVYSGEKTRADRGGQTQSIANSASNGDEISSTSEETTMKNGAKEVAGKVKKQFVKRSWLENRNDRGFAISKHEESINACERFNPSHDKLKAKLQTGKARLQTSKTKLQIGETRLQTGETGLETGETRLQTGVTTLQTGETRLQTSNARLQTGKTRLQTAKRSYMEMETVRAKDKRKDDREVVQHSDTAGADINGDSQQEQPYQYYNNDSLETEDNQCGNGSAAFRRLRFVKPSTKRSVKEGENNIGIRLSGGSSLGFTKRSDVSKAEISSRTNSNMDSSNGEVFMSSSDELEKVALDGKMDEQSAKRVRLVKKPFNCSTCGMNFRYKSHLESHMLRHSGEKPFKCSYCDRTFRQAGTLVRHVRTHTRGRPCDCDRGEFSLVNHVHEGETPFMCSECNAVFSISSDLLQHVRTHGKLGVNDS